MPTVSSTSTRVPVEAVHQRMTPSMHHSTLANHDVSLKVVPASSLDPLLTDAPYVGAAMQPSARPRLVAAPLMAAMLLSMAALWRNACNMKGGRRLVPLEEVALLSVAGAKDQGTWVAGALATAPVPNDEALSQARAAAIEVLQSMDLPHSKMEEWRFNDLGRLKKALVPMDNTTSLDVTKFSCEAADGLRVVMVNGVPSAALSDTSKLPEGVYLGSLSNAPAAVAASFATQTAVSSSLFPVLNTALCKEALCVHVPVGVEVTTALHVVYLSHGAASDEELSVAAPRLLVVLEEGAKLSIIEEFAGASTTGHYLSIPTAEFQVAARACLEHGVVQDNASGSQHLKQTFVTQAEASVYEEVEVNLGAQQARHDLRVVQLGPATHTSLQCFCLTGEDQTHDLHSKILLEHPDGTTNQLHKLIAASPSSRGIFDGNVRVGKEAQKTDAAQMTRSLLMKRGASANVKPNLQIIADDVKCSHGCTVCDLDDEELFYLRSRGLTEAQAREALVFSFGFEVIGKLGKGRWEDLTQRVGIRVKENLTL
uniref:Fe-S cluster assembly protein SufD n=1 Tax=Eutreptiella gymnastica TaxID=73025 RepID=A0A7S1IWR1_9EUGL